ncbi:hypothetical protein TKK_0007147 [Trichogramma kaykai]|uniref:Uncharacterized protein n=1 Tax=Trichogramma kaykai TaxID=54128 RepID=A0ABD2XAE5_9HYME
MRLIVLFFICVLRVRADSNGSDLGSKDDDMVTCLINSGLDPGIYSGQKIGASAPTENQTNCYLACMFKKIGYMTKDGSIDVESILSTSHGLRKRVKARQRLDEIVNQCNMHAKDDVCKLARCFQDLRKSLLEKN